MESKKLLWVLTLCTVLFVSCEKEETPNPEIPPEIQSEEELFMVDDQESSETFQEEIFSDPMVNQVINLDLEDENILDQVQELVSAIPSSGSLEDSIALLEEALAEDPGNVSILFTLTQFYNRAGAHEQEYQAIQRIQEEETRGVNIPTTLQFLYGRAEQLRSSLMEEGVDLAVLMEQIDELIAQKSWNTALQKLNGNSERLQATWVEERRELILRGLIDDTGIRITTIPRGAIVVVDSEPWGISPIEKKGLSSNTYEIEIALEGYERVVQTLDVQTGEMAFLELQLEPEPLPHPSFPFQEVLVNGGKFSMGSAQGGSNERPVHSVTVDSFYMGIHEVSQEQWNLLMPENFSAHPGNPFPVENISWLDAILFCNALSEAMDLKPCYTINAGNEVIWNPSAPGYRLPTEAEWEWAARGGRRSQGFDFPGGDDPLNLAWFRDNSGGETHEVASMLPNELGIYDISGNVWEWCWDSYGSYSSHDQVNPRGDLVQHGDSGDARVVRGGDWNSVESYLSSTARFLNSPQVKSPNLGLRVVRNES